MDLANLDALTTILETAFGDPNQRRNAERKLHTLRIGIKDFVSYYAEFQRYAVDINWDEGARLLVLRMGISAQLAQALIHRDKLKDLISWIALYQKTDSKLREYRATYESRPAGTASSI